MKVIAIDFKQRKRVANFNMRCNPRCFLMPHIYSTIKNTHINKCVKCNYTNGVIYNTNGVITNGIN